jgi:hypothetical protein
MSSTGIEQTAEGAKKVRSTNEWLAEVAAAVSQGDAAAARLLLREVEGFPADAALASGASRCQAVLRRADWLDAALEGMHRDLDEDRFASAVGHFRQALGLSRGLPLLKARVDKQAERHCRRLLPENWRIAETILQEAAATEPGFIPDPDLKDKLKQARHDELITYAIHKADKAELDGNPAEARQMLVDTLTAHPSETRIMERLRVMDHPEQAAKPELVVKVEASQLKAMAATPQESELDTEGTVTDPIAGLPIPWKTRVLISNAAWNSIMNIGAIAATVAMLGTAGLLVWRHFSQPATQPAQVVQKATSRSPAAPPIEAPAVAGPNGTSESPFEDVPGAGSDQDTVLQAVRAYRVNAAGKTTDDVVDEVAIKGNQATVRYRPKTEKNGQAVTFSLVRQGGAWKVEKVQ